VNSSQRQPRPGFWRWPCYWWIWERGRRVSGPVERSCQRRHRRTGCPCPARTAKKRTSEPHYYSRTKMRMPALPGWISGRQARWRLKVDRWYSVVFGELAGSLLGVRTIVRVSGLYPVYFAEEAWSNISDPPPSSFQCQQY
jgi:hypothetical protein